MKQTIFLQNESALLNYAISRLSPEVFAHPVWVRFGERKASPPLKLVDDLLSAANKLQNDDPGAVCQVLLICAVYQNYAGQRFHALKTIQQALDLAQRTSLHKETIWAIWGACAISIQEGNYEQGSSYLVDLQAVLSEQNEWMLADFIDVLRQVFSQPARANAAKHSKSIHSYAVEDMLDFTLDWFQHWGLSNQAFDTEFELPAKHPADHTAKSSELAQSFFSIQRWQGRWHTLMLVIRGELRLQWTVNDLPPIRRRYSFWSSMMGSLRLYLSGQNSDSQTPDDIHPPPDTDIALLPPPKEGSPPKVITRKKKPKSKVSRNQRSRQATTVVPVAVHMLGAFSMTIGDLAVQLPASRGLSLLKYLLLHHKKYISREVLMDVFWPDAEPETARNNLNVALHSLRKALRTLVFLPVIVFVNGAYGLEPNLEVWLDVDEFERCVQAGERLESRNQLTAAVTEYETAISLYQGDFLEQNPYEEWTVMDRERVRVNYLDTLDRLSQIYFDQERYAACITVCQLILARDRCREDAHCLLMRCYSRQGQHHLALRQYRSCVEALRTELDVEPASETGHLYELIRRHQHI